ncbi:gastrokine-1-like [Dipodomys spectabilis]|uniref:gastrokine-1-like n=1 Tax=Dipodomys spectabilis TaxID=105255 RepID=UPI001C547817|nr:gastrokine-1-like [Dipodomys spectabilis]
MKVTMILLGLVGLFIAPGLADYNINVNDDNNVAGSGQQRVSINNAHNVANIDNNNGWDSWNAIWDYENSFAATRLFAKKSCIVHRMNKEVMPSIQTLDALVKEKKLQGKGPRGPPPKTMTFSINPHKVDDLSQFGTNIAGMCQGMPTYLAEEIPGGSSSYYTEKCNNLNVIWILNISFCRTMEEQF